MVNIVVFGDSIVYGKRDEQGGGWVRRLQEHVGMAHGDTVYNLGIPADTSQDVAVRCASELAGRSKPDTVVIIAVGINDSRITVDDQQCNVSVEGYRQALDLLVEDVAGYDFSLVFVGLTGVQGGSTTYRGSREYLYDDRMIKKYDTALAAKAKERGVHYLSLKDALQTGDWCEDGLHPNASGHDKLFVAVRDFLIQKGLLLV